MNGLGRRECQKVRSKFNVHLFCAKSVLYCGISPSISGSCSKANQPMVRFLLPDLDLKSVLEKPEVILTDAAEDLTKHLWSRRRDVSDHPATNYRKKKQNKKRKDFF